MERWNSFCTPMLADGCVGLRYKSPRHGKVWWVGVRYGGESYGSQGPARYGLSRTCMACQGKAVLDCLGRARHGWIVMAVTALLGGMWHGCVGLGSRGWASRVNGADWRGSAVADSLGAASQGLVLFGSHGSASRVKAMWGTVRQSRIVSVSQGHAGCGPDGPGKSRQPWNGSAC